MTATIRMALEADSAAITSIYGHFVEKTAISFEYQAPTVKEMAERIRRLTVRLPWLVLDDNGVITGYAYASPHRERMAYSWSVDTTVYVSPNYQRRGVGRAIYTTLFTLLQIQGYCKAFAGITLPNPASVGLHILLGFEPVGVYRGVGYKLGAWHDVMWYQLSLRPEQQKPSLPLPVTSIFGMPEWAKAVELGLAHYRISFPRSKV